MLTLWSLRQTGIKLDRESMYFLVRSYSWAYYDKYAWNFYYMQYKSICFPSFIFNLWKQKIRSFSGNLVNYDETYFNKIKILLILDQPCQINNQNFRTKLINWPYPYYSIGSGSRKNKSERRFPRSRQQLGILERNPPQGSWLRTDSITIFLTLLCRTTRSVQRLIRAKGYIHIGLLIPH